MEDDAEGEVAVNSQAKGPNSDDTLERAMDTDEATSRFRDEEITKEIFQVKRQRRIKWIAFMDAMYFVCFFIL